eukprot:12861558-Ditylum_brightwellii.AAC.2
MLCLKLLMSHAWGLDSTLLGNSVPAKVWLVTSPYCYNTLLRNNNQYMNDTITITIEGLHLTVAEKEITVSAEKVFIQEYFLRKTALIKSMECTNVSMDRGKCFFVTKQCNTTAASNFLDNKFPLLYKKAIPSELWFDNVPIARCTRIPSTQAVGLYANVSMGMANPQEESSKFNYNKNAARPKKRAAVALDTAELQPNTTYALKAQMVTSTQAKQPQASTQQAKSRSSSEVTISMFEKH